MTTQVQINQILNLLLSAELAIVDDLPCKSAVLQAEAIVLLSQLSDCLLTDESQVILDDFKSMLPK
jgi:hypothetical protein